MSEKMEFRAHDIVLEYIQRHLDKSDDVPNIEVYTVWKCKILQNWKFLISSSLLDGMYYELTFNGDKNEWYLDAYKKFENQVIREDTVNAPQTKRYDYSKSVMENIKCGNGITREIPQNEKEQPMKVGDEVYVHGYIDEIRQDIVIIRNNGGYFGTFSSEVVDKEPCEDLISRQVAIDIERNATVDTNPTHFEAHQKFIQFMDDAEISSFGRWQWSNGFNTALTAVGIDLEKLPSAQPEVEKDTNVPINDCISRQDAIDTVMGFMPSLTTPDGCGQFDREIFEAQEMFVDIGQALNKLPFAQPERKTGKWIVLDECSNEGVYCSECHKKVLKIDYSNTMKCKNFKFCPNCGADMRGDEE